MGLRSSSPACTASLIVGSSKAPWPWLWPWIGSRPHQHNSMRRTTSTPNHVTVASRSTEICGHLNIVKYRHSVKFVVIPFLTGCRPGPILSPSSISFELHAKVAEEIDLEKCSYGQLSEVQMVCDLDLDLDLGSGQGHVNIYSTCRTTCIPNHVTVASRTTEIWPFEFRQISTLDEVWTPMIAFLEGNSKIGLRQAIVQVPYYGHQPSMLSFTPKWRRR